MLNKAILMGRLTADPELKHTQSNIPVTSFTLAVERRYGQAEFLAEADQERKERMKRFPDTYNDAHKLAEKYTLAPRAGWVEPGKRTKDNQAILVRRQEAVQLADDLSQACCSQEFFFQELMALEHFVEQLARGEADSKMCPKCHNTYRTGWMEGKCPYCEAKEAARRRGKEKMDGGKAG